MKKPKIKQKIVSAPTVLNAITAVDVPVSKKIVVVPIKEKKVLLKQLKLLVINN